MITITIIQSWLEKISKVKIQLQIQPYQAHFQSILQVPPAQCYKIHPWRLRSSSDGSRERSICLTGETPLQTGQVHTKICKEGAQRFPMSSQQCLELPVQAISWYFSTTVGFELCYFRWISEKSGVIHSHGARRWQRAHNTHLEHPHGVAPSTPRPSEYRSSLPLDKVNHGIAQWKTAPTERGYCFSRYRGGNWKPCSQPLKLLFRVGSVFMFLQKHHMKCSVTDCSCTSHAKEKKKNHQNPPMAGHWNGIWMGNKGASLSV